MSTWNIVSAFIAGSLHQRRSQPCQDYAAHRLLPSGTLLLACADGAGSAEFSADGARLAVDTVLNELEDLLLQETPSAALPLAFEKALAALSALAQERGLPLNVFATTLTAVILTASEVTAAQLGDGCVILQDTQDQFSPLLLPTRGEYANETYFITMPGALSHLQSASQPGLPQALVLMTDGLLRLALDLSTQTPHPPFFRPLIEFARQAPSRPAPNQDLAAWLDSDKVRSRTEDDKTLVIAVQA
ncbi:MAG TPA: PP2C family serine/threonine-protein phosphatase [Anaerolineaceae bacterium]|nr:PP2C family serine/threonine-protein phosphatase [Anaerolineaceae bacterium]HPN52692.1 PP2C family serine/threonine-protein phosphatase [Anaerolineaceae bacterium]